jgi:hypothetical protein
MIISSEGKCEKRSQSSANLTCIVSTTGIAYTKKSKLKAVIRFFKRIYSNIKLSFSKVKIVVKRFLSTKSGLPNSLNPPEKYY